MNSAASTTLVLTSAYCPPIDYFIACVQAETILIESNESYNKQSYRNRAIITASDGKLSLIVPIVKEHNQKQLIGDVKVDYSRPWIEHQKRTLVAAYQNSPFFEFYCDDLFEIIDAKHENLFDLNMALLLWIFKVLGIKRKISTTTDFFKKYDSTVQDLRYKISPKLPPVYPKEKPYYQVFTPKQGFVSNLSILDLIFNEGPESVKYLQEYILESNS